MCPFSTSATRVSRPAALITKMLLMMRSCLRNPRSARHPTGADDAASFRLHEERGRERDSPRAISRRWPRVQRKLHGEPHGGLIQISSNPAPYRRETSLIRNLG